MRSYTAASYSSSSLGGDRGLVLMHDVADFLIFLLHYSVVTFTCFSISHRYKQPSFPGPELYVGLGWDGLDGWDENLCRHLLYGAQLYGANNLVKMLRFKMK